MRRENYDFDNFYLFIPVPFVQSQSHSSLCLPLFHFKWVALFVCFFLVRNTRWKKQIFLLYSDTYLYLKLIFQLINPFSSSILELFKHFCFLRVIFLFHSRSFSNYKLINVKLLLLPNFYMHVILYIIGYAFMCLFYFFLAFCFVFFFSSSFPLSSYSALILFMKKWKQEKRRTSCRMKSFN